MWGKSKERESRRSGWVSDSGSGRCTGGTGALDFSRIMSHSQVWDAEGERVVVDPDEAWLASSVAHVGTPRRPVSDVRETCQSRCAGANQNRWYARVEGTSMGSGQ